MLTTFIVRSSYVDHLLTIFMLRSFYIDCFCVEHVKCIILTTFMLTASMLNFSDNMQNLQGKAI